MIYRTYKCCPALTEIVDFYWNVKIKTNTIIMRHYPTTLLQGLAFNFNKIEEIHMFDGKVIKLDKHAYIFGQSTCSHLVGSALGVDILGVKFKPLGIAKITGINMKHLADCIITADSIWGREFNLLCDEMQSGKTIEESILVLERFLLKKSYLIKPHHRVKNVENALELINYSRGALDIRSLQNETNTSRKTLERAFTNYVGITPKLYSKITRFNAVKNYLDQELGTQNLSGLAYELGYSDGSHLSADFKRFSNITPGEYLKRKKAPNNLTF